MWLGEVVEVLLNLEVRRTGGEVQGRRRGHRSCRRGSRSLDAALLAPGEVPRPGVVGSVLPDPGRAGELR